MKKETKKPKKNFINSFIYFGSLLLIGIVVIVDDCEFYQIICFVLLLSLILWSSYYGFFKKNIRVK